MTAAATKPEEAKPEATKPGDHPPAPAAKADDHTAKLQDAANSGPPKPENKGTDGHNGGDKTADAKPNTPADGKKDAGEHHEDESESTTSRMLRESQEWLQKHGLNLFGKTENTSPLAHRAAAAAAEVDPHAKLDMRTGQIISAAKPDAVALATTAADGSVKAPDSKTPEVKAAEAKPEPKPEDKPKSGDGSTEDPGWFSKLSQPFVDGYHKVVEAGETAVAWTKEKLSSWSSDQMSKVLDKGDNSIYADMEKAGKSGFDMKAVTDANELKSLKIAGPGVETTFDATDMHRVDKKNGLDINIDREDHHIKIAKDGGSTYEKFADGREVVTKPNGDVITKVGTDKVYIENKEKGTVTKLEGKNVYQQFGDFKVISDVNEKWEDYFKKGKPSEAGVCSVNQNHAACDNGEARGGVTNDGKAIIQSNTDSGRIEIDGKTHRATLFDKDGKPVEGSTDVPLSDFEKKWGHQFKHFHWEMKGDKLVVTGTDGKMRSEVDTTTNEVKQKLTAVDGPHKGETLDIDSKGGKVNFDYKDPEGHDIKKSTVDSNNPSQLYTEYDAKGNVEYKYNAVNPDDVCLDGFNSDGSLDFSFNGDHDTYFEGLDIGYDDNSVSYANGGGTIYRESTETRASSSEVAQTASGNAVSTAAAVMSKAANPADITAADKGMLLSALGDINGAIAQCATAGNFQGMAELVAAKGAVSDTLAMIVPETQAYENALKQGLSPEQANKIGVLAGPAGSMNAEQAAEYVQNS